MLLSRTKVSTFYVLEKIGPSEYISITYECVSNKVSMELHQEAWNLLNIYVTTGNESCCKLSY